MKLKITLLIFALISFFVDATSFYLSGYHVTNALLCVYLYSVVYIPCVQLLSSMIFLLYLQDMLIFGYAGIELLYLIPLTILSLTASYVMYPNIIQLASIASLAGLLHTVFIEFFILERSISPCYTVQAIYANLMGVFLISLILLLSGLLGNRMRT